MLELRPTFGYTLLGVVNFKIMIAVFLLRVDSVTNKGEGEVYYVKEKGLINCNFWNSPKLQDHQVIIANGMKAIQEVFDTHPKHHITEAVFNYA